MIDGDSHDPRRRVRGALLLAVSVLVTGCASLFEGPDAVVDRALTDDLRQRVDRTVVFGEVRQTPEAYVGRLVMFSGVVLGARRAKDRTEIEILHLPREEGRPPVRDRTRSEGRFLAIHPEFLDPAKFVAGLPMTVVGEVAGADVRPLDDGEYRYPLLLLKQLVTWQEPSSEDVQQDTYAAARPYAAPYHWWGPSSYYFGPFGPYPSSPYTNPAACPFCYYPPGGPYGAPATRR